jgi:outer membrane protein assembly factor BamB
MNKTKTTIAIALLLMLTSMLIAATPIANAQYPFKTYTYIVVSPNPVGVGQSVTILFWLQAAPPQISSTSYYGWNFTIVITKPDGTTLTAGPIESDPTGGSYYVFTPDVVGTYHCQAKFSGATIDITRPVGLMLLPRGVYNFLESSSSVVELTVQQEQVKTWPEVPLPTDYWTRPINSELRNWYSISGNWLGAPFAENHINKYTTAPNAPHLVWTKELTFGGISGGEAGYGINYYSGLLYENKFSPYIIGGRLYYGMFPSSSGLKGVICVDLRTGEEIWRDEEMPQFSATQVLQFNTGVQSGSLAYLWATNGSNWLIYDAYTGRLLTTIKSTQGSLAPRFGPNGEILSYTLSGSRNTLIMWNSTLCLKSGTFGFTAETYQPWTSQNVDWSRGIQYNVTVPDVPGTQATSITDTENNVLVAESVLTQYGTTPTFVHVGYNLTTGEEIWRHNWTDIEWGSGGTSAPGLIGYWGWGFGQGYYMFFEKETMQWHVIDIKTGQQHFVTNPINQYTNTDLSSYDWTVLAADGKLFISGYSGDVIAFDLETGNHLWTFEQGPSGLETPYGRWSLFGALAFADNKVFFPVTEHTPPTPISKGYRVYAIDADTGDLIWEFPAFYSSLAFADGYIVGYNGYDDQIYCFGKGPTENTVTTQNDNIKLGNSVLVKGTIMDISSGAEQNVVAKRFPNGLPAMSDDSMTEWMKHAYLQYPLPANATGVNVTISVLDPNGNFYDVATATSDTTGFYSGVFTPEVPGKYTIIATFAGSEAYYGSYAETAINVEEAPPATPPPQYPVPADYTMAIIGAAIAIIIVVVIVGILILRKH